MENDELFILGEFAKTHPEDVPSWHEDSVRGDIIIWGYENNFARKENNLSPIVYTSFEELVKAYWKEKLSNFGKVDLVPSK